MYINNMTLTRQLLTLRMETQSNYPTHNTDSQVDYLKGPSAHHVQLNDQTSYFILNYSCICSRMETSQPGNVGILVGTIFKYP